MTRVRSMAWTGRWTLCLVGAVLGGCTEQVAVPTSYKSYEAKDGSFSAPYPDGWEVDGGSRPDNTYGWAQFKQGPAKIRITADVTGSLIGDISSGGMGGMVGDEAPEEQPVAVVHEMGRDKYAEDFSDYKEGDPQVVTAKVGDGRVARFSASGGKVLGYRATFLTQNRRLTVMCSAPRSQWANLDQAFEHVIKGVGR